MFGHILLTSFFCKTFFFWGFTISFIACKIWVSHISGMWLWFQFRAWKYNFQCESWALIIKYSILMHFWHVFKQILSGLIGQNFENCQQYHIPDIFRLLCGIFCVRRDIIKNIIPQEAQYYGYMSPIPQKKQSTLF